MESKSNKQGLRWKDEQVVWCGLKIRPIINWVDPVIKPGLESPVKSVRILWRILNGKKRWFVQLINEGIPSQKPNNTVADGVVGIDLNISHVALVGDRHADLLPFADKVPSYDREIQAIQRRMQRSQPANNPDCYEPDFEARKGRKTVTKKGKFVKGKRVKLRSKRSQKDAARKRELQRRKAAYTQSENRRLVNEVLQQGKQIKTEKVSVKGWQKRWGKAIASKSPGFFQSELKRKAESAGGSFVEFSTRRTALSQTHWDGTRVKKSLSQRVHRDLSGFETHRDLWSAYLARYVNDDELSMREVQDHFDGLEPILQEAWQRYKSRIDEQVGKSERRLSHSSSESISCKSKPSNQVGRKRARS